MDGGLIVVLHGPSRAIRFAILLIVERLAFVAITVSDHGTFASGILAMLAFRARPSELVGIA